MLIMFYKSGLKIVKKYEAILRFFLHKKIKKRKKNDRRFFSTFFN